MPLANPTSEEHPSPSQSPSCDAGLEVVSEAQQRPPWRIAGLLVIVTVAAVLGFLIIGFLIKGRHRPSEASNNSLQVAQPATATTLRLKGTTEAIQSRSILAPTLSGQEVATLTITKLLPSGKRVKRGELLVEFDRQAQLRDYLDKEAEYNKLVGQVAEERAKENAARAKDETELHQAESDLKSAELDMKKIELLSRIDAEKAEETLEQAKATAEQLKDTFGLKRKAALAAIRILEIQRDRTRSIMENARLNSELMQIRSPLDGVVVLNMIWKNGRPGEAQEGDQVKPGVAFMRVVDPSAMQVHVPVNQEDILGLKIGQTAQVRLDAYPDLVLASRLEQIAPVGRNGDFSSKVRTFSAVFSIQGSDPRLMPDLSAAVDVLPDDLVADDTSRPGSTQP